jgi:hypothetical protein
VSAANTSGNSNMIRELFSKTSRNIKQFLSGRKLRASFNEFTSQVLSELQQLRGVDYF